MKIAILNDTHCGARNSAKWMIEYQEHFYKFVFFPYLKKHNIKDILHLGDYFENRKVAASVEAIQSNRSCFIDKLIKNDIHMYIIEGNHDIFYKNHAKVSSVKTYLTSFAPNNITLIDRPMDFTVGDRSIFMVPWITEENFGEFKNKVRQSSSQLCVGHFEFNGFPMQKGGSSFYSDEAVEVSLFKGFQKVLSGHFHTKSNIGNIEYLGSQFEFTWADCEDDKFFHILDTETLELEAVRNPQTIFRKINFADKIDVVNNFVKVTVYDDEASDAEGKAYLQSLIENNINVDIILKERNRTEIQDYDLNDVKETNEFIDGVVQGLETPLDKDRLKSMFDEIYNKALQL